MFSSWPAEAGKEISRMAGQSAGQHPFLALVPPHGSMREQINWRQFPAQRARDLSQVRPSYTVNSHLLSRAVRAVAPGRKTFFGAAINPSRIACFRARL